MGRRHCVKRLPGGAIVLNSFELFKRLREGIRSISRPGGVPHSQSHLCRQRQGQRWLHVPLARFNGGILLKHSGQGVLVPARSVVRMSPSHPPSRSSAAGRGQTPGRPAQRQARPCQPPRPPCPATPPPTAPPGATAALSGQRESTPPKRLGSAGSFRLVGPEVGLPGSMIGHDMACFSRSCLGKC